MSKIQANHFLRTATLYCGDEKHYISNKIMNHPKERKHKDPPNIKADFLNQRHHLVNYIEAYRGPKLTGSWALRVGLAASVRGPQLLIGPHLLGNSSESQSFV